MNRLKLLSSLFALSALVYTLTLRLGGDFAHRVIICENALFRSLQPWDSACFYSSIFKKENTLSSLHYEKYKLDSFTEKGGLSPGIIWYRSVFFRVHKDVFNYTDVQINNAHWDYVKARPHKIRPHVDYLNYLSKNQKHQKAQEFLDLYCYNYMARTPTGKDVIVSLYSLFNEKELKFNLDLCKDKFK